MPIFEGLAVQAFIKQSKQNSDRLRSAAFAPVASVLLLSLALLAGCAPTQVKPDAASEKPVVAAIGEDPQTKTEVENLPNIELTPQILYQLLLAEISGQRGDLSVTVAAYADLANSTRDPRIARRAAEVAVYARQNEAALAPAQLWVELSPESLQARQLLVGILASMDKLEEAETHLKFVLERDPRHAADILMRLTRTLARSGERQDLARMVERVSENMKAVPEAGFARAYAAHALGDPARGLKEVEQTLAQKPDWEQAVLLKAQLIQDQKGAPEALAYLKQYLAAHPQAREVRQQYARALAGDKKFNEARAEFKVLEQDQPGNGEVGHALAVLALQSGDLDEARRRFEDLLNSGQGNANALRLALGQLAEMQRRPDDALAWYDKITLGEQYVQSHLRHANLLTAKDGVDVGRTYLQNSAKRLPKDAETERIQFILGESNLLRDANRNEECFQTLEKGLATYPGNVDLLYDSALAAEKIGKSELAESRLRELIRIRPDHAHAYNALGYSLTDRGVRLDEAQQLLTKAVELAPTDPFIMDSLGWLLFRRGDLAGAATQLGKALSLRADPEIAAHLGEVQWNLGQHDVATRTWTDALQANPGNDVLVAVMKKYLEPAAK